MKPDVELFQQKVIQKAESLQWTEDQLRDLKSALTDLIQDDLTKGDKSALRDEVIDFARGQAMRSALIRGLNTMQDDPGSMDHIRGFVRQALEVGKNGMREMGTDFFAMTDDIEHLLSADARYMGLNVVGTFWPTIDRCLIGGIGAGEVGLIVAPTNRGKSTVLVNLGAAALLQGRNVVHVTLEMKEHAVALRYAARITGISQNELLRGAQSPLHEEARDRLNFFKAGSGAQLQIVYRSPGTCVVADIGDQLERLYDLKGTKPGLLIIDYMDELGKAFETELYVSGGKAMQEMIALGDEWMIPVWTATQARRDARAKTTIHLEDIGESWQKASKSHVVITLNQTEDEYNDKEMRLFLAKVREGKVNVTVPVRADMAKCIVKELPREAPIILDEPTQELRDAGILGD
jgi:replicative DNA helicase